MNESFTKAERICSKRLIEKLFAAGNPSMAAFPLRAVYMLMADGQQLAETPSVPLQVLISVPKRRLHHATDRNRLKRQVREAYRRNKQTLWTTLQQRGEQLALAFVFIGDVPCSSPQITRSICKILRRINESLTNP